MKIVVLDGYTLNPGDLDWQALEALGEVTLYDRTPAELTIERAADADVVLTNKVVLGEKELAGLPQLRYIGVLATGVNVVDIEAARARNIPVTNVPAYSTPSVAQHVFALLLELTRGVGLHAEMVRQGDWASSPDFSFWKGDQVELAGLTMGIVGFGGIGKAVARVADAFGMTLLVATRTPDPTAWPQVRFVELSTLLAGADVVSLHCPLTAETERMIDGESLALMKTSAYLINTGRGPLIDESALAEALNEGRIAGAGLDVLSQEPPSVGHPLFTARNCLITPHLAWATKAARLRLMKVAVTNVRAFINGTLQNQVN
jgi:glycerate dehydrogenase